MKIIIVLPSLDGGGAEKLCVNLANFWVQKGINIKFVVLNGEGELMPLVSPSIEIINLNVTRISYSLFKLANVYRKLKPDVIWVNMWPLTSIAIISWLISFVSSKIFITDHINLTIDTQKQSMFPFTLLKIIIRLTYPFATGITAVSSGVAKDINNLLGLFKQNIKVIYNPAYIESNRPLIKTLDLKKKLWGGTSDYKILAVGKFKLQKNYSLLLKSFSLLSKRLNAKLIILGEGELRMNLEQEIISLGLSNKVDLPGFKLNTSCWYSTADLFVMSSDWEGFGNVIVEALGYGLPVVSTDCQSGPSEILNYGEFGTLVPVGDVHALTNAMFLNLIKLHDRKFYIERAKEFSVQKISNEYLVFWGGYDEF